MANIPGQADYGPNEPITPGEMMRKFNVIGCLIPGLKGPTSEEAQARFS